MLLVFQHWQVRRWSRQDLQWTTPLIWVIKQVAPIPAYGIYTIPEVSMAGYSESQLNERNVDYVCGKAYYNQNARGMIVGDEHGLLKLLFETKTMKLVGVHVIGESASELIHAGLIALMSGLIMSCY